MAELFMYFFFVGAGLASGAGSIILIGWIVFNRRKKKESKKVKAVV